MPDMAYGNIFGNIEIFFGNMEIFFIYWKYFLVNRKSIFIGNVFLTHKCFNDFIVE